MKYFIAIIILLIFPGILFAAELPIYDKAEFNKETYFHEKYGENYTRNVFKTIDEIKQFSSLKFSTATIIKCPQEIRDKFKKEIHGSKTFDKVMPYGPIYADKCVDLKIRDRQIYVLQINIEIKLTNTSNSPYVEPIIWIGLDEGNSIKTEFFYVSESRFFEESRRNVSLAAIADVDNDGLHEIVIKDERYAGSSFIIFEYRNGKLNRRDISGDSWD